MSRRTRTSVRLKTWEENGRTMEGVTVRRGSVFVFLPFSEVTLVSDAMIDSLEEHLSQQPPAPEDTP